MADTFMYVVIASDEMGTEPPHPIVVCDDEDDATKCAEDFDDWAMEYLERFSGVGDEKIPDEEKERNEEESGVDWDKYGDDAKKIWIELNPPPFIDLDLSDLEWLLMEPTDLFSPAVMNMTLSYSTIPYHAKMV